MSPRFAFVLPLLGLAFAAIGADDPTQRIVFESRSNTATLEGTVAGYRSLRYVLTAPPGQVLSTSFVPSKKTRYYNVLQGTPMLRNGSSADELDWSATLPADG